MEDEKVLVIGALKDCKSGSSLSNSAMNDSDDMVADETESRPSLT